jgi:hypothetical protein
LLKFNWIKPNSKIKKKKEYERLIEIPEIPK